MTKTLHIFFLMGALLILSTGGCRRQRGVDTDTDSDTASAPINTTDSGGDSDSESLSSGTDSQTSDTQSSISDTATTTAVIIVDTEDTVTETAVIVVDTEDTTSSTAVIIVDTEDTATTTAEVVVDTEDTEPDTDTWSNVPSADPGEWKIVFENPDGIELDTIGLAENGDVLAYNHRELFWIAADGTWRRFLMDDIDFGNNQLVQALGSDDGLWAVGYGYELFFVPNVGDVQSLRPVGSVGRAQPKHMAVFDSTLYVISTWNPVDTFSGGGFGYISSWDGSTWMQVTTGEKDGAFHQLHNLEDGAVVAASYEGIIAVFDGVTWEYLDSQSIGSIVADVWGLNANDFWVAADSLYHYDGVSFVEVSPLVDDIVNGEFEQISQVNGVTGTANNDMFVSVVYIAGYGGGGCDTCDKASGKSVDVDEDIAQWEESYLAHYDGAGFSWISGVANTPIGTTDMALLSDDLFISGARYVVNGDTVTSLSEYPLGGMDVDNDTGSYLYASTVGTGCNDGAMYDGTSWACLEMGRPLTDILSAPNGIVYGLSTGSEVLMWQDGMTRSIHSPKCSVWDYYLDSATDYPVARCQEGHQVAWDGTAWHTVDGPPAGNLAGMCFAGDTLYGFRTESQRSTAVRIEAGIATEIAVEFEFDAIACNESGAVLFDHPRVTTEEQRFFEFDDDALTQIASWRLSDWNGAVYDSRFAIDDEYNITALVFRDGLFHIAKWDGSTWQLKHMPDNIIVPDFAADGRLFAQDYESRALLVYTPRNQ